MFKFHDQSDIQKGHVLYGAPVKNKPCFYLTIQFKFLGLVCT